MVDWTRCCIFFSSSLSGNPMRLSHCRFSILLWESGPPCFWTLLKCFFHPLPPSLVPQWWSGAAGGSPPCPDIHRAAKDRCVLMSRQCNGVSWQHGMTICTPLGTGSSLGRWSTGGMVGCGATARYQHSGVSWQHRMTLSTPLGTGGSLIQTGRWSTVGKVGCGTTACH